MKETILTKVDAELAAGRAWRAREILSGAISSCNGDAEVFERHGAILLQLGDWLEAGRFLFLSGARRAEYQPAIALFLDRHGRTGPAQLKAQLPRSVRGRGFEVLHPVVQADLLARGVHPWLAHARTRRRSSRTALAL